MRVAIAAMSLAAVTASQAAPKETYIIDGPKAPLWSEADAKVAAVPTMSPLDYVVAAPELVGKRVRIEGARVFAATPDYALLGTSGTTSTFLRAPWSERGDLRFLLANCATFVPADACTVTITGTVSGTMSGNVNELNDVDFEVPGD